jgi:hypothetical protein
MDAVGDEPTGRSRDSLGTHVAQVDGGDIVAVVMAGIRKSRLIRQLRCSGASWWSPLAVRRAAVVLGSGGIDRTTYQSV